MLGDERGTKLRLLASVDPSDIAIQKIVLSSASDSFLTQLLSILLNVVLGTLKLTTPQYSKIRRYSSILHTLVNSEGGLPAKRVLLRQRRYISVVSETLSFVLPQVLGKAEKGQESEWKETAESGESLLDSPPPSPPPSPHYPQHHHHLASS